MTDPTPPGSPASGPITSGGDFAVEIFRFLAGYGILFVCLVLLLRRSAWSFGVVDGLYWGVLLLVLFLHRRAAKTSAERAAWARSCATHLVVAGLLWVGGQSVQLIT